MSTFRLPTPGSLVMYEHEGTPLLGVVIALKKDRFAVWNEREREIELTSARIHPLPGQFPNNSSATSKERTNFVRAVREAALEIPVDLEEAWQVLSEEPREYTDAEICDLLTGEISLTNLVAVRLALLGDKILFKRGRQGFEPRPESVVASLRHTEAVREERERAMRETLWHMRERLQQRQHPMPPHVVQRLNALLQLAAESADLEGTQLRETRELLSTLLHELPLATTPQEPGVRPTEASRALEYLIAIGFVAPDVNLATIKYGIDLQWPPEILSLTEELADALRRDALPSSETIQSSRDTDSSRVTACPAPTNTYDSILCSGEIQDLRGQFCITIDDSSTQDVDDALSFVSAGDTLQVGIHITNVSAAFAFDSPIDRAARQRATSVYCPDLVVPMLPPVLSEEALSLIAGKPRRALSVLVDFNQRFEICKITLCPSIVAVTRRLSYDEVDAILDGDLTDPEGRSLAALSSAASAFEELRLRMGAQNLDKREAIPRRNPDGTVGLLIIDEESPSRKLVSEMMILYNWIIARFARATSLPIPFRGQEPPDAFVEPKLPEGPARDFARRSQLKRSTVTMSPQYHYTLGLGEYVQSSSPIRRYLDLITQRQVLEHLCHKRPLLSGDVLQEIIFAVETPLTRANSASKESRRYWLLKYLEQRRLSSPVIEGVLVRHDEKIALVHLDEVWATLPVKLRGSKPLGTRLTLHIAEVYPRHDIIRLVER